jgi:CheY-like chemotaxis protein
MDWFPLVMICAACVAAAIATSCWIIVGTKRRVCGRHNASLPFIHQEVGPPAPEAPAHFLVHASHEIRAPMNAVLGMTRLLLDSSLSAEQRSWVDIIHESGENLLSVINDVLDLSKMEAGHMAAADTPFDLLRTMAEVTDLLIHKTEQKNIVLCCDSGKDVPRFVRGDPLRLKQIILNLLNNAVKFTSAGQVILRIYVQEKEDKSYLRFRIEDTGIGIPADRLQAVFGQYTQAETTTSEKFGGTGLGLAIVKKLVTLLGGTIQVTSLVGKGSIFSFELPLNRAPSVVGSIPNIALEKTPVLILTDHPLKSTLTKSSVENCGKKAVICQHPDDVIGHLQQGLARQEPYAYILIDHAMNSAKLLDLIDRVHLFPDFQNLPFIVVETLGSASAARILNSNQVAAMLTRPLFTDQLGDAFKIIKDARMRHQPIPLVTRSMIERLCKNDVAKSRVIASFKGSQILVVEDIEANHILMDKMLQKMGCVTDHAHGGQEALDKLRARNYDLVFMDGHMPGMDGVEATRHIRLLEQGQDHHTIIVALTADALSGDSEKYLGAGMDDYLAKPITPERLSATLGKWVARA